ncbi:dihydroxyacetone kinase phosphotransfer subunit [Halohasta litchfieldiae]|uniref:phosphoenolpyruvate--glycerone phosphotransferase n=1 Tax=Halohasta litchfieldiae TaxID=1073996 RepID=A0A1H6XK66_9EURY|nr:dihydroxyacetone kinase phosphoryl donor subunit DhaM [Halohasta litchfieldiae]ATW89005.1 dihydroxyacetone kinase phosphotransfer subunit [Halohasta litchfieldiae]SEJ27934.1 dihydroxyacetone kinase DhaM subunit [Halohasta litchfieldiae]
MIGLVVVSHSAKAAEGICELAAEMGGDAPLKPAGGDDGEIGTDATRIQEKIEAADDGEGVVVLVDLGSAVMNAELAIEMGDTEAVIADAPILEGTLNAAVEATSKKATVDSVVEKAEEAQTYRKLS